MKKIEKISYGTLDEQVLEIFLPDTEESFPVFVYFHGGGLDHGSYRGFDNLAKALTKRGIAIVSAEYRKYPTAKYPDFIEDAALAVKWTVDNISSYGNADKIYVGGSSAGGYLSMMLCFDVKYLENAGVEYDAVAGYFHDAGQPTSHLNILREKGIDPRRIIVDETAPLFHVGLRGNYPPMHFVVSDKDIVNRYEQTMLMISTLSHFGFRKQTVSYTLMHGGHCEYVKTLDDNGENVLGLMVADFIKEKSNL